MLEKHNEEATWDDMDWGAVEPDSSVTPPKLASSEQMEPPPEPARSAVPAAASDAVECAVVATQNLESAPVSRIKPEVHSPPPLSPEVREASVKREVPAASPRVFVPASVATLTLADDRGEEVAVTIRGDFTIGRLRDNDLVIRDQHVSGHHAKFACLADGTFEIIDLNSSGGTYVNGRRIERAALASGDEIIFSTVTAHFRYIAGARLDDSDELGTLPHSKAAASQELAALRETSLRAFLMLPDDAKAELPFTGEIGVGRASKNDVQIKDKHVSGHHARLIGKGGGVFELVDLKSTCGTFVNEIEITSCVLSNGDNIRFGTVECVFMIEGDGKPEKSQSAPPPPIERPLPEPRPAGRAAPPKPSMLPRP